MQRSGGRSRDHVVLEDDGKNPSSGHIGTRIEWVRLKGPMYNIFYIVVYIQVVVVHKGRTVAPQAEDTIVQFTQLLQTVKLKQSECVILGGDFNCQLQRFVSGCTGKWCMTQHENKGHGNKILNMMRTHDLCAIDTFFKPKRENKKTTDTVTAMRHTCQKTASADQQNSTTCVYPIDGSQ